MTSLILDIETPFPLPSEASTLLIHPGFITRITSAALNRKKGRIVNHVLSHLVWENESYSFQVITCVIGCIKNKDYDQSRGLENDIDGLDHVCVNIVSCTIIAYEMIPCYDVMMYSMFLLYNVPS